MTRRWLPIVAVLAVGASGCSFSYSSKSLSESSGGLSRSSTSSSPDDAAESAYRDDVRDQTVAFVDSGDSLDAFQASVSDVARRHGIVDWEASRATYVGIGQGLARARVRGERLATLETELVGSDPTRRSALRAGYESVSR